MIEVRSARDADWPAIWPILEPIIRAGETYALPRDMEETDARAFWFAPAARVFVAERAGVIVGTAFVRPNHPGGGDHVANAGFATDQAAEGQGVARTLCEHALEYARSEGFAAMQFNFVVSTNVRAVRLWQRLGFLTVGTLPGAFRHPRYGTVDVYVMYRVLAKSSPAQNIK